MSITFSAKIEDLIRGTIQGALNIISPKAREAEPQKSYNVIIDDEERGPFCLACAEKISDDLVGNGFVVETDKTGKDNSQSCSECKCLLEYELSEEGAVEQTKRFLDEEGSTIDLKSARQCYEIERVFRTHFPNLIINKKLRCEDLAPNVIKLCNKIRWVWKKK